MPWLLVNLGTAFLSASVIAIFDGTIEQMVALAILMPIVASLGGNAGTQTMTVTVRALATRDLDIYNAGRVIRREVMVGLLNGAIIATHHRHDRRRPGSAMPISAWSSPAPWSSTCWRPRLPASSSRCCSTASAPTRPISSSVFTTMATDCVGFLSFLGLATWWLDLG